MTLQSKGVDVWKNLVAALDGVANQGGDFGVHPGLDYVADKVVGGRGFEAVDCETGGINADLDPTEEEFGGWLGALKLLVLFFCSSIDYRKWMDKPSNPPMSCP